MAELKKIIVMLIILFFLFPALDLAYGEPTQHSNRYNHVSNDHLSSDTTQTISTADKDMTPEQNNVVQSTPAEKKTPQITWSKPADITYGTALSSNQLNAVATDPVTNAPVAGTLTYTPVDGTVLNTGTQTLQVVFTPTDAANYNTATQTVQINVVQSTPEQNNIVPSTPEQNNVVQSTPAQNNVVQSTPAQNNVVQSTPAQNNVVEATPEQNNIVPSTPEQNNIIPSTPAQKITPTIRWSKPADITYGTALSNTQLNAVATDPVINAQVAGTFTCSPGAGAILSVGTHTLHVDFAPQDTETYNTASAEVQIKVVPLTPGQKITPIFTWSNPADITSGTALSSTQLNAVAIDPATNALVAGTFTCSPGAGAILAVGTHTLHVDFTPQDTETYNTASAEVQIKVIPSTPAQKITPILTWSNPADITYGTALSSTQLNAVATDPVTNALVAGTFTCSPGAGTILSVGTHTLHVDFTPQDTVTYNTASADVKIKVVATDSSSTSIPSTGSSSTNSPPNPTQKITPEITWSNPADIASGTALSSTQLNAVATDPATNALVAGTFTCSPGAGTILSVGTHTLHVDFAPQDTATYNTASAEVQIKVLATDSSSTSPSSTSSSSTSSPSTGSSPTGSSSTNSPPTPAQKITPTIRWSNPADITSGTALSSTQLNAVATDPITNVQVAGTFTCRPGAGTILAVGTHTLYVDFTPQDTVTYNTASADVKIKVVPLTPDQNNVVQSTPTQNKVVQSTPTNNVVQSIPAQKITPTIRWSNPADITYGTALSSTQLNAVATDPATNVLVAGTFTCSPGAGTILSVGTHTLHVDFTPQDTVTYNTASADVQIKVVATGSSSSSSSPTGSLSSSSSTSFPSTGSPSASPSSTSSSPTGSSSTSSSSNSSLSTSSSLASYSLTDSSTGSSSADSSSTSSPSTSLPTSSLSTSSSPTGTSTGSSSADSSSTSSPSISSLSTSSPSTYSSSTDFSLASSSLASSPSNDSSSTSSSLYGPSLARYGSRGIHDASSSSTDSSSADSSSTSSPSTSSSSTSSSSTGSSLYGPSLARYGSRGINEADSLNNSSLNGSSLKSSLVDDSSLYGPSLYGSMEVQEIPEFPSVIIPVVAILGLLFISQRRKEN